MKKILTSILVLSTGIAFAKNIDFDTVIKWNSEVISTALTKAGFITSSNAAWDVRKTHERILDELVKKQSFSLRQATQVCLDKCNMSDFLKNGRGQSGKKCPDLCTGFVDALIAENNNRAMSPESRYSAEVEEIGYCFHWPKDVPVKTGYIGEGNCNELAKELALKCRCKLKAREVITVEIKNWDNPNPGYRNAGCFIRVVPKTVGANQPVGTVRQGSNSGALGGDYTPTFQDCVSKFNEKFCKKSLAEINDFDGGLLEVDSINCQEDFKL
ncbi:MAG: hypothetical protein J6T27_00305 [Alphaproteobacteria bacterium]|nr:hypothetical protein [Alphaproteobacteria bacterium]